MSVAFDDAPHPVEEPIVLYVCRAEDDAATVTVSVTDGVEATPESLRMTSGDPEPSSVEVRLIGDSDGRVEVALAADGTGNGGTVSLDAVVDDGEWSLERP